jgi:hypothetical protein
MKEVKLTAEEVKVFEYLNRLRKKKITNMFGATPYIQELFGFDREKSSALLAKWRCNFNEEGYKVG